MIGLPKADLGASTACQAAARRAGREPFAATNGYKLTEVLWAKSAAEALNAPEPSL